MHLAASGAGIRKENSERSPSARTPPGVSIPAHPAVSKQSKAIAYLMVSSVRSLIVAAARESLGAGFRHQARGPDAYDCVGLVITIANRLGLSDFDIRNYTRQPNPAEMRSLLEEHLDYVRWDSVQPGDILWFRAPEPQHLAIVTEMDPMRMVHAFARVNRVVETSVDRFWRGRLVACFKYRGV